MSSMKKTVRTLLFCFFVILAYLAYGSGDARATIIYEWDPCVVPTTCSSGDGGAGAITLTPGGIAPTETDFTTSTVTDFFFTFDNGAPTVLFSDITVNIAPSAIAGFIHINLFREIATYTDARLVFAAGSADYKNFIEPIFVPSLFPVEINSGHWVLSTLVTDPVPIPVPVPEPSTLGMFAIGLAGLGVMTRRRRKQSDLASVSSVPK